MRKVCGGIEGALEYPDRAQLVGSELSRLLREETGYRQQWLRHVVRDRGGDLNMLAIAKQLFQHAGYDGPDTDHLALKDRVRRALNGTSISAETLRLFLAAFAMGHADAARLWELYDPAALRHDVIRGSLPDRSLGTQTSRTTISLIDEHIIGPDRFPSTHLTTEIIESNVDGFDSLPLFADTDEVELEVEAGGSVERQQSLDSGFPAKILVRLDHPLDRGQRALVRYRFAFRYTDLPDPIFSRAARHALNNLFISVQFHPDAVPRNVHWRVWSDYGHRKILHEEPVDPGANLRVTRHLSLIQDAIAGFQWDW